MKKFKFKSFRKKSGKLTAFSLRKNFPIRVKRIFIINGEKNFVRGDHAHKKCSQFVYSILGRIKIELISKKDKGITKPNIIGIEINKPPIAFLEVVKISV